MLAFTPLLWVQVVVVVHLVRTHKVQGPLHVWPVTLVHTLSRLGPPQEAIILLLELRPAFRVQEALFPPLLLPPRVATVCLGRTPLLCLLALVASAVLGRTLLLLLWGHLNAL